VLESLYDRNKLVRDLDATASAVDEEAIAEGRRVAVQLGACLHPVLLRCTGVAGPRAVTAARAA
jgi:hypothetical protein